jgi:hypothetical protein
MKTASFIFIVIRRNPQAARAFLPQLSSISCLADCNHIVLNFAHAYIVLAYVLQQALHIRFPALIPFYKISLIERPQPSMADSCIYERSCVLVEPSCFFVNWFLFKQAWCLLGIGIGMG